MAELKLGYVGVASDTNTCPYCNRLEMDHGPFSSVCNATRVVANEQYVWIIPNTRSTDERVVALHQWAKGLAWSTRSPYYAFARKVRVTFPELFPACKPSEEEA